jgi:hypothetical protein
MNYTDIINRAFRTLKSGGLWGFVVTVQLALLVMFAVAAGVGFAASGGISGFARMFDVLKLSAVPNPSDFAPLFILYGALAVAGILSIPLSLISYGGMIRLTDDAQAGRPVTVGAGWAQGARLIGRVFLVELVFGLITMALFLVSFVPIILGAVAASRGGDNPGGGAVAGICGGLFLLVIVFFALILMGGFEALAVRYAVIGDRTAGDAVGAGWAAFRARFGSVLLLMLILFGFGFAVYIVQTALNYAVQFATMGSMMFNSSSADFSSTAYLSRFLPAFGLLMLLSTAMSILTRIFGASMWTAFFRQMTGLDPLPQPAGPYPMSPYGAGYYPAPTPPGYVAPMPPTDASQAPPTWMPPTPPQPPAGYAPSQPPQGDGQTFAAYPGPYPQPNAVPPRSPYDPYNRSPEHSLPNDPYSAPPADPPMAETPEPPVPPSDAPGAP